MYRMTAPVPLGTSVRKLAYLLPEPVERLGDLELQLDVTVVVLQEDQQRLLCESQRLQGGVVPVVLQIVEEEHRTVEVVAIPQVQEPLIARGCPRVSTIFAIAFRQPCWRRQCVMVLRTARATPPSSLRTLSISGKANALSRNTLSRSMVTNDIQWPIGLFGSGCITPGRRIIQSSCSGRTETSLGIVTQRCIKRPPLIAVIIAKPVHRLRGYTVRVDRVCE